MRSRCEGSLARGGPGRRPSRRPAPPTVGAACRLGSSGPNDAQQRRATPERCLPGHATIPAVRPGYGLEPERRTWRLWRSAEADGNAARVTTRHPAQHVGRAAAGAESKRYEVYRNAISCESRRPAPGGAVEPECGELIDCPHEAGSVAVHYEQQRAAGVLRRARCCPPPAAVLPG